MVYADDAATICSIWEAQKLGFSLVVPAEQRYGLKDNAVMLVTWSKLGWGEWDLNAAGIKGHRCGHYERTCVGSRDRDSKRKR